MSSDLKELMKQFNLMTEGELFSTDLKIESKISMLSVKELKFKAAQGFLNEDSYPILKKILKETVEYYKSEFQNIVK